jgi:hypothetical protein
MPARQGSGIFPGVNRMKIAYFLIFDDIIRQSPSFKTIKPGVDAPILKQLIL